MEASAHLKMNPIILSMLISKSTTVTLTGAGTGGVFAVGAAGILICVRLAFASASLIAFCSDSLMDAQRSVCSGGDKFKNSSGVIYYSCRKHISECAGQISVREESAGAGLRLYKVGLMLNAPVLATICKLVLARRWLARPSNSHPELSRCWRVSVGFLQP